MGGQRVTQTIFADDENRGDGVYGNCLQAAVASLLALPLDAVPHFSQFVWWDKAIELWARGRQLTPVTETPDDWVTYEWPDNCIVYGESPRGISHAVAIIEGEWWDPHPSRAGLTSYKQVVTFERWPPDVYMDCGDAVDGFGSCIVGGCPCNGEAVYRGGIVTVPEEARG